MQKKTNSVPLYYNYCYTKWDPKMSDSLSNLFSHIKNGQKNHIFVIEHVKSNKTIAILNILQENGYIRGYRILSETSIQILLKYKNQKPVISEFIRLSKPSRKVYMTVEKLNSDTEMKLFGLEKKGSNGFFFMQGILILSTSKGILSHITAQRLNVGGEVIGYIYS